MAIAEIPSQARDGDTTRQLILDAATRLFADQGYNGTPIAQIAADAGVSNAGLLHHHPSKQHLLYEVLDSGLGRYLATLEEIGASSDSPSEKMAAALDNHFDFIFRHSDAIKVFQRERRFLEGELAARYQVSVRRYDRIFGEIIGQVHASMSPTSAEASLMRLAVLGMINWIIEWYDPSGRLAEDQIRTSFKSLIMERLLGSDQATPQ